MIAAPVVHDWVVIIFAGLLIWIAITDVRQFTIPNRLTAALLVLYPAHALYVWNPVDLLYAVSIAAAVFLVCAGMFAMKWLGGGDVKLLAVVALWAGADLFVQFLLLTGLAGGLLAMTSLVPVLGQFLTMPGAPGLTDSDAGKRARQSIPYGLAIAAGGIWVATQLV